MIWLTWRQFRTQAWFGLGALVAVAATLAITAPAVTGVYRDSGLAACRAGCDDLADAFLHQARTGLTGNLYWAGIAVMFVVPALIGVFWGAPLVAREFEAGTHRLVWNQSVARTKWLALKLGGVGLAAMATAGLLSLAVTWWTAAMDQAGHNRMFPEIFATRGIVPVGYAGFSFAVGVTAGMLTRKVVPAMAVTLAVVIAAQVVTPFWIREHLVTPVHVVGPLTADSVRSVMTHNDGSTEVQGRVTVTGAWTIDNRTLTPRGAVFDNLGGDKTCLGESSRQDCNDYLASLGLRQDAHYLPPDRFWALQRAETALFLGVSLLLAGLCFWLIRRRAV